MWMPSRIDLDHGNVLRNFIRGIIAKKLVEILLKCERLPELVVVTYSDSRECNGGRVLYLDIGGDRLRVEQHYLVVNLDKSKNNEYHNNETPDVSGKKS